MRQINRQNAADFVRSRSYQIFYSGLLLSSLAWLNQRFVYSHSQKIFAVVVAVSFTIIVWRFLKLRVYPHIVTGVDRYRSEDIWSIASKANKEQVPHQAVEVARREGVAFAYLEDAMAFILTTDRVKITNWADFVL